MIKTIGLIMIITSCSMAGMGMQQELFRRRRALRAHSAALQLIRTEIIYKSTPMDQILSGLAEHCGEQTAMFYHTVFETAANGMAFSTAAERHYDCLAAENLYPEDVEIIRTACRVLGRYDSATQAEQLENCMDQLEKQQAALQTELDSKGRIYRAVGATVGIVLALIVV